MDFREVVRLADGLTQVYRDQEIPRIKIIYARSVNSLTFTPGVITLLPIDTTDFTDTKVTKEFAISRPSLSGVLNRLIPMYLQSVVCGYLVGLVASKNISGRAPMGNATNNAQELIEDLLLKCNQARQTAITNEISEIAAGANTQ